MTTTNAACRIEQISGAIVEDDIIALLTAIGVTIGEIDDTPPVQRTTQEFLTMLEDNAFVLTHKYLHLDGVKIRALCYLTRGVAER